MTAMTMTNTGTPCRAARTAPMDVFENIVTIIPDTIGQAIQAAVDRIQQEGALKPFSPADVAPFAQTRAALTLLTDCYARQIYSSAAAAHQVARDPDFPWPWWEELPDANALRRFRAEHSREVQRCLMAALRFLTEQKILSGALTKIDGPQLAKEAGRRIVMAAFEDSMELDGE